MKQNFIQLSITSTVQAEQHGILKPNVVLPSVVVLNVAAPKINGLCFRSRECHGPNLWPQYDNINKLVQNATF
jgi:hypothetical protein